MARSKSKRSKSSSSRSKRSKSKTRTAGRHKKNYSVFRASKPVSRSRHKSKKQRSRSRAHSISKKHRRMNKKQQVKRVKALIDKFHSVKFKCPKTDTLPTSCTGKPNGHECIKYNSCKDLQTKRTAARTGGTAPWPKSAKIDVFPTNYPLPCPGDDNCAKTAKTSKEKELCEMLQKKCNAQALGIRNVGHLFLSPR